jgi:hypothetical protein
MNAGGDGLCVFGDRALPHSVSTGAKRPVIWNKSSRSGRVERSKGGKWYSCYRMDARNRMTVFVD